MRIKMPLLVPVLLRVPMAWGWGERGMAGECMTTPSDPQYYHKAQSYLHILHFLLSIIVQSVSRHVIHEFIDSLLRYMRRLLPPYLATYFVTITLQHNPCISCFCVLKYDRLLVILNSLVLKFTSYAIPLVPPPIAIPLPLESEPIFQRFLSITIASGHGWPDMGYVMH